MSFSPEHVAARTWHGRRGRIANAFAYGVDFVLIDPDTPRGAPLLSRNRFNLWSVHDHHHGGERGKGVGAPWARRQLCEAGLPDADRVELRLLTQPSLLGMQFNPVSFWLAFRGDDLIAAIAEVNNTFGDRHNYLCAKPGFAPIHPADRITARKLFHVSPFQETRGRYTFNFRITADRIAIRIDLRNGDEGVLATLNGARRAATAGSLVWAALRRPFGAARILGLIHWQALKLWVRRAPFHTRPEPPSAEISAPTPPVPAE
ncbi:DUF1365 domain-containing protein [Shimia biformata]|uniref:DUF1365 domain-containing protein n=1 Tax=Shimia biformata TaxID=1294299 RepID=UPI00194F2A0C|nr:DUF1365 domain-containing protein [Shimia biformata]